MVVLFSFLMLASGYRPFYDNGKISFQKTGMIIANSKPQGADVYLNDKRTGDKTSYPFLSVRLGSLQPGNHKLSIKKEGHVIWEKVVEVKENFVTWANYVLLFPEKLEQREVKEVDGLAISTRSKNNRYYVLTGQNTKSQTEIYLYDVTSDSKKKVWPISKTPIEPWLVNPQIAQTEISPDNSKLLVWVKRDNATNLTVLDLANENSGFTYQIDQTKGLYTKILWNPKNSQELIALSAKTLYKLNLGSESKISSQTLETEVIDFSIEGDNNIYYVKEDKDGHSLQKMSPDGNNKNIISDVIEKSTSYKFAYSRQEDIIALLAQDSKKLVAYYRLAGRLNTLTLDQDIVDMSWSKDGSKILYVSSKNAKFFDWEKMEEKSINTGKQIRSMYWYYDNYHFVFITDDGEVIVSDFDGSNQVSLASNINNSFVFNQSSFFFEKKNSKNLSSFSTLNINF